jgi:ABC-type antimicrobial peptide transport system permease subunit
MLNQKIYMDENDNTQIVLGIGVILLAIGLLLITPFLLIWSVNGLFSLTIQYTWSNWLYALVIMLLVRGSATYTKTKSK